MYQIILVTINQPTQTVFIMNLHEYQGKQILNSFGVKIQRGVVATTSEEAVQAAKQLTEDTGTGWHVIKAQIHAGGRGKGGRSKTGQKP